LGSGRAVLTLGLVAGVWRFWNRIAPPAADKVSVVPKKIELPESTPNTSTIACSLSAMKPMPVAPTNLKFVCWLRVERADGHVASQWRRSGAARQSHVPQRRELALAAPGR
jgi:hypothetical protein